MHTSDFVVRVAAGSAHGAHSAPGGGSVASVGGGAHGCSGVWNEIGEREKWGMSRGRVERERDEVVCPVLGEMWCDEEIELWRRMLE